MLNYKSCKWHAFTLSAIIHGSLVFVMHFVGTGLSLPTSSEQYSVLRGNDCTTCNIVCIQTIVQLQMRA